MVVSGSFGIINRIYTVWEGLKRYHPDLGLVYIPILPFQTVYILLLYLIIIIIIEDIYIALYHANIMLKRFSYYYPNRPVSFYIYILFLNLHSGAYSPISCGLNTLRLLSCTIQAHLMPGTQFNHLGGVKCVARGRNLL